MSSTNEEKYYQHFGIVQKETELHLYKTALFF